MCSTRWNKGLQFAVMFVSATLFVFCSSFAAGATPDLTDQSIGDKVEDEMLFDPGVSPSKIDVHVNDGVITLSGTVNNILAKERAAKLATTVKGVRSVVNRIQVKPSEKRKDADIALDIDQTLLDDPATESFEIRESVSGGVATLTGSVDSYQERDLVITLAKGVRGVTDVVDKITVEYRKDRPDQEIKSEINEALRWKMFVDNHLIIVNVNNGAVSLSGTVGSSAEKRRAESIAWVAGVKSVDTDKLSVARWSRDEDLRGDKYVSKTANEIRDAIQDALALDPRVAAFDVDVDVMGSLVTLRGQVDNLKAKRAAENTARNTVGVSYVTNRLKVRPIEVITDHNLQEKVEAAFVRDPYVERFDISTVVIDGTAYLYGTVDSFFEKARADDLASRVAGVVNVKNHLGVDYDRTFLFNPYVDNSYFDDYAATHYNRRASHKTDSQIKEAIKSELWWSPFVDSTEVDVKVDDGIARLSGNVATWSEYRAATENAYEGGATLVDNDLTVGSSS